MVRCVFRSTRYLHCIYSSYIIFLTVGKIHEYLGTIKLINVLEIIFIKKKPPQLSFEIYNLRLEKIVEKGKCTYPGKHSLPLSLYFRVVDRFCGVCFCGGGPQGVR